METPSIQEKAIVVWVVEDHPEQRKEVASLINADAGLNCNRTFPHCEELLQALAWIPATDVPDVLIMDYQLDAHDTETHMDGVAGTRKVRELYPDLPVVMLTINENVETIFQAIGAGALGYITKPPRALLLHSGIRQALEGGLWMPPMVARSVASYLQDTTPENPLSPREQDVLSMMETGMRQKQIAEELSLSPHTVNTHVRRIYKKLHVKGAALLILGLTLAAGASPSQRSSRCARWATSHRQSLQIHRIQLPDCLVRYCRLRRQSSLDGT